MSRDDGGQETMIRAAFLCDYIDGSQRQALCEITWLMQQNVWVCRRCNNEGLALLCAIPRRD